MNGPGDRPTITVCGLGPGAPDLMTERTGAVLDRPDPVYLRTARHPGAERLAPGAVSFDAVYDSAASFREVYRSITDALVAAAGEYGRVTYCVPGSPLVLERSVAQLRTRDDVAVDLVPAVSFLDEVWARLSVDPVDAGVRLVDGHRFAVEAAGERGPLLVAHAHARWVLSDIKLALLADDPAGETQVLVLQRLGTADERIFEVPVADLDRRVEADHLTSLYLPAVAAPIGGALIGSVELMRRLRTECPWDRNQNHATLRRYLIEEAYEVLDVLDRIVELQGRADLGAGAPDGTASPDPAVDDELVDAFEDLESELGDLWLQILFHSRLASESGHFDVSDVAATLTAKMIGRHPHVFGTEDPDLFTRAAQDTATADSVESQWDRLKAAEATRTSIVDGIPTAMPALARASKILRRLTKEHGSPRFGPWAGRLGLDRETFSVDTGELGRLLLAVVEAGRVSGVDPEEALREATNGLVSDLRAHEESVDRGSGDEATAAGERRLSWVVG